MTTPEEQLAAERNRMAIQWLAIAVERFKKNIKKERIGSTEEFYNSFLTNLVGDAGGDEMKLRISYAIQGMYSDMGVGRGMGAGIRREQDAEFRRLRNDRGQLHRHKRKAKRWQSKQLSHEQKRLAELLADVSGRVLIASVRLGIPESVPINL